MVIGCEAESENEDVCCNMVGDCIGGSGCVCWNDKDDCCCCVDATFVFMFAFEDARTRGDLIGLPAAVSSSDCACTRIERHNNCNDSPHLFSFRDVVILVIVIIPRSAVLICKYSNDRNAYTCS